MSEENNLENFFNNILNVMQMEVKHIFYGNIAKEDARKSVEKYIDIIMDGNSEVQRNLKIWASEYLDNCECKNKKYFYEWHDLKKDPEDLPEKEGKTGQYSINVLNELNDKVFYDYKNKEWREPVFGEKVRKPDAWHYYKNWKDRDF